MGTRSTAAVIEVWVRPGSAEDALSWDPWRRRWVVACRAPPVESTANRAVLGLLAGWLGLPESRLRLGSGGRSRSKRVVVDGLSGAEVRERLEQTIGRPARTV